MRVGSQHPGGVGIVVEVVVVVVVEVVVEVEVEVVGGHVDVEEWHRHSCCPEQVTVAKHRSNG
jgi:hypothetical protein